MAAGWDEIAAADAESQKHEEDHDHRPVEEAMLALAVEAAGMMLVYVVVTDVVAGVMLARHVRESGQLGTALACRCAFEAFIFALLRYHLVGEERPVGTMSSSDIRGTTYSLVRPEQRKEESHEIRGGERERLGTVSSSTGTLEPICQGCTIEAEAKVIITPRHLQGRIYRTF